MRISAGRRHLAAAVALLVVISAACHGGSPNTFYEQKEGEPPEIGEKHAGERVEISREAVERASIEAVTVAAEAMVEEIRSTAIVRPNEYRLAHVSPRIPGKAIEVRALLGASVEQGQVLCELDSLELGEKKAAFLQSRTSLEVARRNYEREDRLFKRQISSEKEYLGAKGDFERSEAAYQAAREALRLLGITDDEITKMSWGGKGLPLSHFPLRAPFAGTIIEQHLTMGELVKPEDVPYTVADLGTLWIIIDVHEKQLPRIAVGAAAEVAFDTYPAERFAGRITYLAHVVDDKTRTSPARIEIDNRDGRLRPGMFATATIASPAVDARKGIVVPSDAIQRIHGARVAFVEEAPGRYVVRELNVGKESAGAVEVISGLAEGERVVARGAFYLKSTLLKEEVGGEE